MKLPSADRAVVDPRKVREYLLSDSHPIGRSKAAFFRALGYSQMAWKRLAADLVVHAQEGDVTSIEVSRYGRKYEVRGTLQGPSGRAAGTVAVWIVLHEDPHGDLHDDDVPRLVTAYPGHRS